MVLFARIAVAVTKSPTVSVASTAYFSRYVCLKLFSNLLSHELFYKNISRSKHTLPDLPYDYSALEPVISAEIMQLHHSKHHQVRLIYSRYNKL